MDYWTMNDFLFVETMKTGHHLKVKILDVELCLLTPE